MQISRADPHYLPCVHASKACAGQLKVQVHTTEHVQDYFCLSLLCYLHCRKLKDSAQIVPYSPKPKDPPLIKAVMHNLLPQAVLKIEKVDPGGFSWGTGLVPGVAWVHVEVGLT